VKTIYLHIGAEKTATTSLQRFFKINARRLLEAGIWYPTDPALPYCVGDAHFSLAASLLPACPEFIPVSAYADRHQLYGALAEGIEGSPAGRVLLSDEHFSSRCSTAEATHSLRELLADFRLRAVIYLRPQEEQVVSLFSMALRAGRAPAFPEFLRSRLTERSLLHYDKMLAPWWDALGPENVIVRVFQTSRLRLGSVYRDFLGLLGLGDRDDFEEPPRLNESMSREAADFLQLANRYLPFLDVDRDGWERAKRFRHAVLPLFAEGTPLNTLLTDDQRERIRAVFAASNAKVASTAWGEDAGDMFDLPSAPPNHGKPYLGLGPEQLVRVLLDTWSLYVQDLSGQGVRTRPDAGER
jgi:hypothetical protein